MRAFSKWVRAFCKWVKAFCKWVRAYLLIKKMIHKFALFVRWINMNLLWFHILITTTLYFSLKAPAMKMYNVAICYLTGLLLNKRL